MMGIVTCFVIMYILGTIKAPWWLVGIYLLSIAFRIFVELVDSDGREKEE